MHMFMLVYAWLQLVVWSIKLRSNEKASRRLHSGHIRVYLFLELWSFDTIFGAIFHDFHFHPQMLNRVCFEENMI